LLKCGSRHQSSDIVIVDNKDDGIRRFVCSLRIHTPVRPAYAAASCSRIFAKANCEYEIARLRLAALGISV
jgi:hypothetical protein